MRSSLAAMRFAPLLRAVPRIGGETSKHMLSRSGINGMARIREVNLRRRELLAGQLLKAVRITLSETPVDS